MSRAGVSQGAVVVVLGLLLGAVGMGACGDDRSGFENRETKFEVDASVDAPPECKLQCSIDRRSVVDSCTGQVVEACPDTLACGAGACIEPCAAATADRSSNGCDFYLQPPLFDGLFPRSCYAAFVVNTSLLPATISLELAGKSLDLSEAMFRTTSGSAELIPHEGAIPPGESVIVFVTDRDPSEPPAPPVHGSNSYHIACPGTVVPATHVDTVPRGTGRGVSFHLTTNVPVATTTIYPFGGADSYLSTATLLLPVPTWGKEHMIINGWQSAFGGIPAAQIVASEDDTKVTILPKRTVQDGSGVEGGLAGAPLEYRLSRGQFLQLVQGEELTGSIVSSDKPTTVIGGNSCAWVTPSGTGDVLAQQIPAYEQWGSEYVGVGYRPRLGNEHEPVIYRIVAARDGTQLDYDPAVPAGAPVTMSAGESAIFESGTGDAFVVRTQGADHPIYLAAYMTGGGDYYNKGDPEFVNVVPSKQYLNAYSFYADTTYDDTSLVVVRAKSNDVFEDVWLECAGVLTGWKPVGTRGQYEWVRVDLQRMRGPGDTFGTSVCQVGLQRMKSNGAFTATLWGWAHTASYAYPGGMAQRKLVDVPLTPVR